MTIDASSDVRTFTVDQNTVAAVLQGTPLDGHAGDVMTYAGQYGIDPNFFLSYVAAENNFGQANTFSASYNNWIDELCLSGGNMFASGCGQPGNGYSYAVYPSASVGIQAAFWQFQQWIPQVGSTWGALLNIASGNSATFLDNALTFANDNAGSTYGPIVPGGGGSTGGIDLSTVILAALAYIVLDDVL